MQPIYLKACQLWSQIEDQSRQALASGALHPYASQAQLLHDGAVDFVVRVITNLARKDKCAGPGASSQAVKDPFLPPYETDLYVGDLSATHVALLNKFNVLNHHLLIVTRNFEDQRRCLTAADFDALALAMTDDGLLGFYNAGPLSGASQSHKHLQVVRLPLAEVGDALPMRIALNAAQADGSVYRSPRLPFAHAILPLNSIWAQPAVGAQLLAAYRKLLQGVGLPLPGVENHDAMCGAYNLLLTRQWMWLVPRRMSRHQNIDVNALAYAGALLLRDETQLEQLQRLGPMQLLCTCAGESVQTGELSCK